MKLSRQRKKTAKKRQQRIEEFFDDGDVCEHCGELGAAQHGDKMLCMGCWAQFYAPQYPSVPPVDFIRIAKKIGLIEQMEDGSSCKMS